MRADVFAVLLTGSPDVPDVAGTHVVTTVVGVTVPLASLMGFSDQPGELADRSASIPAWVVAAALTDTTSLLFRLVTDGAGNLLDATSLGRFAPAVLRMVLSFRDGTSVFPTLMVPAGRCDVDHTVPYPGPTTASNMGPVHRRAHNLKTADLLRLEQPEPGLFVWSTRTGHVYAHKGDPLPVADWAERLSDQHPLESCDPRGDPGHTTITPDPLADCYAYMGIAA